MNNVNKLNGLATDWGAIVTAGAGIFDSFKDARTSEQNNESQERQRQLQLEAQRLNAASSAQQIQQYTKLALIGGWLLIVGIVAVNVIKN